MANRWEKMETVTDDRFYLVGLQNQCAAMKLKDAYSLEGKL